MNTIQMNKKLTDHSPRERQKEALKCAAYFYSKCRHSGNMNEREITDLVGFSSNQFSIKPVEDLDIAIERMSGLLNIKQFKK